MTGKKNSPTPEITDLQEYTLPQNHSSISGDPAIEIPTDTILNSITDGIFTVDTNWVITSFNRSASEITGIAKSNALGQRCSKILCSTVCGKNCPMVKTLTTKIPIINVYTEIVTSQGATIPVNISTSILRNQRNEIIGGTETFQDLRFGIKIPLSTRNNILRESNRSDPLRMEVAIQAAEAQTILAALRKNNFNRQAAARDLGIHKSTFFRKIKNLGITLPHIDGRFRLTTEKNGQ